MCANGKCIARVDGRAIAQERISSPLSRLRRQKKYGARRPCKSTKPQGGEVAVRIVFEKFPQRRGIAVLSQFERSDRGGLDVLCGRRRSCGASFADREEWLRAPVLPILFRWSKKLRGGPPLYAGASGSILDGQRRVTGEVGIHF